jgi:hypothetical protein
MIVGSSPALARSAALEDSPPPRPPPRPPPPTPPATGNRLALFQPRALFAVG